ncbi:MAG TPA: acyl-CoA dehydrogenase, partial [Ramlibacter sp.]|nr:acyl-CoA dehydrogenase [Ramlibacter sp.]
MKTTDARNLDAAALPHLQDWVGKTETLADTVTPVPVRALSATLDLPVPDASPGLALPPLWHWLYFLPL